MSFFKKKNKEQIVEDGAVETVESTHEDKRSKKRKKKKERDMMASIINESVTESAIDDMRENTAFLCERDGKTLFVGLYLNTEDIGGLDKKSRRDETKGQIIEQINSGSIKTFIPRSLLDNECMVIIPTVDTLDIMDEFSLLSGARYTVALVDLEDASVEDTGVECNYEQFTKVATEDITIMDLLADLGFEWALDDEEEPEKEEEEEQHEDAEESNDFDDDLLKDADDTEFEDYDSNEEEFEDDIEEPSFSDEDLNETEHFTGEKQYEDEEENEQEDEDYGDNSDESEEIVDSDTVAQEIKRKFYSDELGLEVTTEPFDLQFLQANTFVPFPENREEGWINNYLNEYSKEANLKLKKLHEDNLFKMRNDYFNLLSKYVAKIRDDLDYEDMNTAYGQRYKMILQNQADAKADIPHLVSEKKSKLEQKWAEKLEEVGNEAKLNAISKYRARLEAQHENDIMQLEPNMNLDIEYKTEDQIRKMHEDRKREAASLLDAGVSATLRNVYDEYLNCLEQEKEEYKKMHEVIMNFLDENRKDDIAHTKALAEELAQIEKAEKVASEYEAKIKAQAAEFASRVEELNATALNNKLANEKEIETLKAEHERKLSHKEEEAERLQEKIEKLIEDYAKLDEKKEAEYSARLQALKDANENAEARYDLLAKSQKRGNMISIALSVVLAVATCAIGVLVGSNMKLNSVNNNVKTEVVREVNNDVDANSNK